VTQVFNCADRGQGIRPAGILDTKDLTQRSGGNTTPPTSAELVDWAFGDPPGALRELFAMQKSLRLLPSATLRGPLRGALLRRLRRLAMPPA